MPAIAFGQLTTHGDILAAAIARLVAKTGYGKDAVFETLDELDEITNSPPGSKFIAVSMKKIGLDGLIVAGSGGFPVVGLLSVSVCTHFGTDQATRSTSYLRDVRNGLLKEAHRAAVALHLWDGITKQNESILMQPARVTAEGITFRAKRPKTGWGSASFNVELLYRVQL